MEREKKIKDCDHPNVVKYIDSWEEGDHLYIQMELCQKDNLAVWLLKNDKAAREAQFLSIFKQIVSAVKYLHSKGFIHRDLKVIINKFLVNFRTFQKSAYSIVFFSPKTYFSTLMVV